MTQKLHLRSAPPWIALVHTVSQKFTAKIGKTSIKPQEKQKNSQKIPYIKKNHYLCNSKQQVVMLEWLKRHAWKACNRQKRFGSSNLPHSAINTLIR